VGYVPGAPLIVSGATDGEVGGFAIDLLRSIAETEDWRLELVEIGATTLAPRLAACELDVGVASLPLSAELAASVDFSLPYLSTITTAVVHAEDASRAGAGADPRLAWRLVRAAARGVAAALLALAILGLSAWLLNSGAGLAGLIGRGLHWRRADAAVGGPWSGLRWLWRSATGRVLAALWCGTGLFFGATDSTGGAVRTFSEDPVRRLVEAAAQGQQLLGERLPDHELVRCSTGETQECLRSFADGALAALAGPRETLCAGVAGLALAPGLAALRDDVSVPESFAYFLPPESPLRRRLNAALLQRLKDQGSRAPIARCPGEVL
jgi:ABC-type amino acid transport substrate-binding protein